MLDFLWQLAVFFLGISIGKLRSTNMDISSQTIYMQDLINQANIERDKYESDLRLAEQKIESWQRRYDALLKQLYSEKE